MTDDPAQPQVRSGVFLAIAGAVGLVASFTLTIERFRLLTEPGYRPSCSINPILSCGSVMVTWQARVFGFPNPLLGICGFTVVALTGVLLASRVLLPRWYLVGFAAATILAVGFIHWLIFQSLYRINALCPYCMLVWVITITTLAVALRLAFADGPHAVVSVLSWRWTVVIIWAGVIITMIYLRFADYWNTLLP